MELAGLLGNTEVINMEFAEVLDTEEAPDFRDEADSRHIGEGGGGE